MPEENAVPVPLMEMNYTVKLETAVYAVYAAQSGNVDEALTALTEDRPIKEVIAAIGRSLVQRQ